MIATKPVSRAELERMAHEQYLRHVRTAEREPDGPGFTNAAEARTVDAPTYFVFRGVVFRADPLPYEDGLALHEILLSLPRPSADQAGAKEDAPKAATPEEMRERYRAATRLYGRLAAPARGWRRWLRRVLPNPFRHATETEIWSLLDFFWTCRTGQNIESWVQRVASMSGARPRTSSADSTPSSSASSAGRHRGATTSTG